MFQIEQADGATREITEAIGRLLPFLSTSARKPSQADVEEVAASPATVLFLARDPQGAEGDAPGPIVGTLTLAMFRIPTGLRAWIEDVIVDEAVRGRGCGEELTLAALDEARRRGARTVELTSRASRQAANRLYQRLGFTLRETNVYRYELD